MNQPWNNSNSSVSAANMRRTFKYGIAAAAIAFIVLPVAFGSWYTVDQKDVGIVQRNGAFSSITPPGLHLKVPFIDSVIEFYVRENTRTYRKENGMSIYSKDIQPADLIVSVNYSVQPMDVEHVYKSFGVQFEPRALDPMVFKSVKEVMGRYTAPEIVSKRAEVGTEIEKTIRESVKEGHITIHSVQIENVDFSDAYEKAIESAMKAEAAVKQTKQELERDKVEAEKNAALAKGSADAQVEKARGMRAIADAEAYAIQKRGEALRQNPSLVEMTLAEKWDGKLPQQMVPGGAVPFIGVK